MNKNIIWSIVAVIAVAALIWVVQKPVDQGPDGPIKIGAVLSLTGDAAPWGAYAKRGLDLAVKTINAEGGIDGRMVTLVVEDDHTSGKDAASAFNKLASVDGVQGVIGGVFDFTAQPILPLAESHRLAFISPSNFRIPQSFELGDNSFVMLVNFSDAIRKFEGVIARPDVKKLAVVHFKSAFGEEIAKTLDAMMKEAGKQGIVDESYTEIGGNDFRTTVAKLKREGVDTVFLDMLGNDPINFLKRSRELGFSPRVLTYTGSTDAFTSEADKALLEGVMQVNWEISSPDFDKLYFAAYGEPAGKSTDKAFDALYIMANAIAKSRTNADVAPYIAANEFVTPNATVRFTDEHIVESTPVEVQVYRNGRFVKAE